MKTKITSFFSFAILLISSFGFGMQTPAASSSSAPAIDTQIADEGAPISFFCPDQLQRLQAAQEQQEQLVNDRKELAKQMDMHWQASQLTINNVTFRIPLSPRTKAINETIYLLNSYKMACAKQSPDASDILLKAHAALNELAKRDQKPK